MLVTLRLDINMKNVESDDLPLSLPSFKGLVSEHLAGLEDSATSKAMESSFRQTIWTMVERKAARLWFILRRLDGDEDGLIGNCRRRSTDARDGSYGLRCHGRHLLQCKKVTFIEHTSNDKLGMVSTRQQPSAVDDEAGVSRPETINVAKI
jgi:hypothetical protein